MVHKRSHDIALWKMYQHDDHFKMKEILHVGEPINYVAIVSCNL